MLTNKIESMPENEYRNNLIVAEQKSQDNYDKTIITLSGGALAISLVFIKDVIGDKIPIITWALVAAWSSWGVSITSVIISFYSSQIAFRKAIEQTDDGDHSGGTGGIASKITNFFNALSGISFVLGVVFLIIFASNNLSDKTSTIKGDKIMTEEKRGSTPPPPPKTSPSKSNPLTEGTTPAPPPPKKNVK